ncbi:MAG: 4'-phosphopantetheinyl transferase family protein [Pirellulales bacterium]
MIRLRGQAKSDIQRRASWLIENDQLHLWRIGLDLPADIVDGLYKLLNEEEQERVAGFLVDQQASRFTVCRAAVRQILSSYLGCDPQKIEFEKGEFGKPHLKGTQKELPLKFNITHSADLGVLAITKKCEVGVDVERIRTIRGLSRMVERCLVRAEQDDVMNSDTNHRGREFLRFWTHKEAYLKTYGVGIRHPMDKVTIDLAAPPSQRVVNHCDVFPEEPKAYISEVWPGDEYVGAVAVAGTTEFAIETFSWVGGREPA